MSTWIGLALGLVSALTVNWAYTLEHDAAVDLPPLSPRQPVHSAWVLLRDRGWLIGFGTESGGWLLYVAALALAPLALVQAVSASGIAVLALIAARGHPRRLAFHQQLAVVLALVGLGLLSGSLLGLRPSDRVPATIPTIVWLGACAGGAFALTTVRIRASRAAAFGLAAGLMFAGGDISVKLVVYGGWWLIAVSTLLIFYGVGTMRLQAAFQQGDALTAAGMATLATNAVPIAAGFVLFDERLPVGVYGGLQLAGFTSIVLGAVALANPR
ncbi:MAG: hypothetical protein ACRDM1_01465 [Gaiellaceae bacterium]